MIIDLVTKVLELNVNDVQFDSIKKFTNISEYKFSMVKAKCDLCLEEKIDIYFKFVKKDKIKETIFCYWCLLYEEALKQNKQEHAMASIINKVIISEIGIERYKNSVFLEIKDNNEHILEHGTEIHFMDFIKYIQKNKSSENQLGQWLKYIEPNNDDIFMIGIVLNEDIGRSNIRIVEQI